MDNLSNNGDMRDTLAIRFTVWEGEVHEDCGPQSYFLGIEFLELDL